MEAGLANRLSWDSLGVAFVVPVPVNRSLIRRGLGHAVVHEYHR